MFVEKLFLTDFRNYKNCEIRFSKGTNVIFGENARGKTNILEAINIMSTTRSHRNAKENELIRIGQDKCLINLHFYSYRKKNIGEVRLFLDKKRQISINSVPVPKASDIMGYLNTVIFCPEDLKLIKGSPRERRKMMDLGISQLRKKYFHSLSQYYKILEQKNKLLKDNPNSEMLWVWNEKLCETGTDVIWYRKSYIDRLDIKVNEITQEISGEKTSLIFDCGFEVENYKEKESIKKAFSAEIEKNIEREKKLGISVVGPHRDDFKILLNGNDSKLFASQGQQRTIALAIKMAEVRIIEEDTEETPVLLLDDVLSELDEKRRNYVLNNIKNMQVIITCTDKDMFGNLSDFNMINVESIKK